MINETNKCKIDIITVVSDSHIPFQDYIFKIILYENQAYFQEESNESCFAILKNRKSCLFLVAEFK